ncbi:hypothetical protein D3C85_1424560 [compost metagenome]
MDNSFITRKGVPLRGTTAKIGRSQGNTSVWKLVANWKKSADVKMTASTARSSIMDAILSNR